MTDYVRVRQDETGHELTVRADANLTGLTVIDKPALGHDGLPAPMKPKTTVAKQAAAKKPSASPAAGDQPGQTAETDKEK